MFVGRRKELDRLERMYKSDKFEMAIIYGRRRVGKTTLIQQFCKGKKAIYSVGRETNKLTNLECVSRDIYHELNAALEGNSVFQSWENVFSYLEELTKEERIILVLDEYPYFASTCPELSSILQAHIDHIMKNRKIFVILCGSSMSFMENQVLGYQSPLYGRRTAQFKINPFTYSETKEMLPSFGLEDQAIIYSATGGIPEYLSHVNPKLSLRENLIDLFFSDNGILYEEPSNLLKQELREPATYNDIIAAIAKGATRLNDIAGKVHIESNKCSKYITSLIALGIIEKEKPVTEDSSKKSIYHLSDQMFRFWYFFVQDNASRIISGDGELIYENIVEPQLSHFMGIVFEKICYEYWEEQTKRNETPFFFQKIGRWWGNNPKDKCQEEIDLIAYYEKSAAFGECKWRNELVDLDILLELQRKSELFPQFAEKYYYVFSKSGFTKKAIDYAAKEKNWNLVSFSEM